MLLEVIDSSVKQVFYSKFLKTLHCEGLSWASLAVGKDSDYACVEYMI